MSTSEAAMNVVIGDHFKHRMPPLNSEQLRQVYVKQGLRAYRKSDQQRWHFALFASRIVGKYERGATLGFASDANVSVDKVENDAHAYQLFEELCAHNEGMFRTLVFAARRAPFIYLSHFRALYDARNEYKLDTKQVLDLLMDIVQAEGGISSRAVDVHTRTRYGDTRDWTFYAKQALKGISELRKQPDLPQDVREQVDKTFNILGDHS